jgi:hypothetical protein
MVQKMATRSGMRSGKILASVAPRIAADPEAHVQPGLLQ